MVARFGPPLAQGLLDRPHLHARLNESRQCTAWVSGPAGAGKTSLLATWGRGQQTEPVWLEIDRADRDSATFLTALTEVLDPGTRADLPPCHASTREDAGELARRFLRAWYCRLPRRAIVILDNLHEAMNAGDGLDLLLPILIEEKPPAVTLVLSSRLEPRGRLLALASDPATLHLDYAALQCRDEDICALARSRGVASPDLKLLARADGWMAGITLLLRQQSGGSDPFDPMPQIDTRDETGLFDCFAMCAFDGLPPTTRELLLLHAECPSIRPEAADQLLDRTGSAAELDALWQAQFFIERHNGEDGGIEYVCHALLRSFLRQRLRRFLPRDRCVALWNRQAGVLEASGNDDAAFDLWLLAGERKAALQNLLACAPRYFALGRFVNWLDRLKRFRIHEDALASEPPELANWEGNCLRWTDPPRAIGCHRRAGQGWEACGNVKGQVLATCAVIQDYLTCWDRWPEARHWVDEAHRLYLPLADALRSTELEYQVLSTGYGALMIYPDHPLLWIWFERGCELLRDGPWHEGQLTLSSFVMGFACWNGRMTALRELSLRALQAFKLGPGRTAQRLGPLFWCVIAGSADGHACDHDRRQAIDLLVELCETVGLKSQLFQAWIRKVQAALSRNDLKACELACQRVAALDDGRPALRGMVLLSAIAVDLLRQDWREVIEKAETELQCHPAPGGWVVGGAALRIELAEALSMVGEHERAAFHVGPVLALARRWRSPTFELLSELVLADGDLAHRRLDQADARLRRAFGLAQAHGFVALPWGAPLAFQARLAARALEAGIATQWVRRLIRVQRLPAPSPGPDRWPYAAWIEVLGPFRLVTAGAARPRPGRASQRVLEVLKAIVIAGGVTVCRRRLETDLWRPDDQAGAAAALDIAIHRLRRLLGDASLLILRDGLLSLDPAHVDSDLSRSRRLLDRIDGTVDAIRDPPTPADPETRMDRVEESGPSLAALASELARQFPAPLLEGERELGWVVAARAGWQQRLERTTTAVATACLEHRQIQAALRLLERGLEAFPDSTRLGSCYDAIPGAVSRSGSENSPQPMAAPPDAKAVDALPHQRRR